MARFFSRLFGGATPPPRPTAKAQPNPPAQAPVAKAAAQPAGEGRAALLKRAQEVHRAKRKIFDHLSDEDRAKLVGMAILTFLNQGREPDSKK